MYPSARGEQKPDFSIEVIRDNITTTATLGEMGINGQSLCYTLEPAPGGGPDKKGPIPEGSYTGHLRYDKKDQWRIQLDDVPKFQGIQIHIGNIPKDTAGCILVGLERDVQNGTLGKSADAYQKLKKAFYGTDTPEATPDKSITVTISSKK